LPSKQEFSEVERRIAVIREWLNSLWKWSGVNERRGITQKGPWKRGYLSRLQLRGKHNFDLKKRMWVIFSLFVNGIASLVFPGKIFLAWILLNLEVLLIIWKLMKEEIHNQESETEEPWSPFFENELRPAQSANKPNQKGESP